jgi:ribose transport system substrate-binding protein
MKKYKLFLIPALVLPLLNCAGSAHDPEERYVLVVSGVKVPYWQQAAAGFNQAARELGVKTEVVGPDAYSPKEQHEWFRDALRKKPTGILVSASDPVLLKEDIDAAIAQGIPVIAVDADATDSGRLMFVGTDNYKAGVMGAQVAVRQLKGKGNVLVFTNVGQLNVEDRLRGYRDTFAGHPGIRITEVVDIKGDPSVVFDRTTEVLEKNQSIDAFVCLLSIAGPEVVEVLSRRNVKDKVVVAMDTDERTLDGIQKGMVTATIAQKPFTMAYVGLKMLDSLYHHPLKPLKGRWAQDSFSPIPTFIDTGATLIDQGNVAEFLAAHKSATTP